MSRVGGAGFNYVLGQLFGSFSGTVEHADAARRDVYRFEAENFSVADLDLKAEPVGTEKAAGGIKSHRSGNLALIVIAGAAEKILV